MQGKSLASPLLTLDFATRRCLSSGDRAAKPDVVFLGLDYPSVLKRNAVRWVWAQRPYPRIWAIHSTPQTESTTSSGEDQKIWEACKQALSELSCSEEEQDKILGKAFGHVHSPYWGEERKKEIPRYEVVNAILEYLRSLSLSDEDLYKVLKKFPEVLGCCLEDGLKTNVRILERDWGIKGKSLKNLLLRNPKVLGYNVDCKGDCMAQCTRCWARF